MSVVFADKYQWLFVWENILLPFDLVSLSKLCLSAKEWEWNPTWVKVAFFSGNLNFKQIECKKKTEWCQNLFMYTNFLYLKESYIGSFYLLNYPWFPYDQL